MPNRIITVIILCLFIVNMSGCTSRHSVKFFANEIPENLDTKVESVQLCSKVRQITLKNNEVILVSDKGVRFNLSENKLIALDKNGVRIEININDVKMVQSTDSEIVTFFSSSGQIDFKHQTLTGMKSDRTGISIPLSDVCYVTGKTENRKLNVPLTFAWVGLISTFIVIMVKDFAENGIFFGN